MGLKKGYIRIPINEVWELVNKPWRFYKSLYKAVTKLECGDYEYLDFDIETKKEILDEIRNKRRK